MEKVLLHFVSLKITKESSDWFSRAIQAKAQRAQIAPHRPTRRLQLFQSALALPGTQKHPSLANGKMKTQTLTAFLSTFFFAGPNMEQSFAKSQDREQCLEQLLEAATAREAGRCLGVCCVVFAHEKLVFFSPFFCAAVFRCLVG